ncbi:hypothetical protein Tco_1421153 [Tanacetum coccineum]
MGGRRSKQDIINTVGTMGLKGLETSWNNSTAKVHKGTDEVLKGTAQEYESTAGANLSTAEVYESTAHSLFKISVEFHRRPLLDDYKKGKKITGRSDVHAIPGKLWIYDEVRTETLFVVVISNRGKDCWDSDLMRQTNKEWNKRIKEKEPKSA